MIVGVGVDIVEIERVHDLVERHGASFLNKVFTPAEIELCQDRPRSAEHFAARFAAKEAVVKALGTGFQKGVMWKDIQVLNGELGEPVAELSDGAAARAEALNVTGLHVSLSHGQQHAVAMVVAEAE